MKFIVFILLLLHLLTSTVARANEKNIELFMSNDSVVGVGTTNIVVTRFKLHATSADEGAYRCNFEWVMDYKPRQLYRAITDTNNDGYAYTYFDRTKDYTLFNDWVVKDAHGTIIGRGTPILPVYPEKMLRVVFTNITMLIDYNYREHTLECSVSQSISEDMLTGILNGDQITLYPNVPKVQFVHENGEQVTLLKPYPVPVSTKLSRQEGGNYHKITSMQRIGDDYLITAQIDPPIGRILRMTTGLGTKFATAGDSYVIAPAGEAYFLVPKSFATNESSFYRLITTPYDPSRAAVVRAHIKLPGEGVNNAQYRTSITAGTLQVTADVVISPMSFTGGPKGDMIYTWLSDEGESMRSIGIAKAFNPTFKPGVHWIKLCVTSHNVDAAFFTWVLVK